MYFKHDLFPKSGLSKILPEVISNAIQWLKALVQYIRRLLGTPFRQENVNDFFSDSPPFPSEDVFMFKSLYINVIVWPGLRADMRVRGSADLQFGYQIPPPQVQTSHHHTNREVLKNNYSAVTTENCYKGQNPLSFLIYKKGYKLTCYIKTHCFHFVKISSHNNKSDIRAKTSQLRKGGDYELYLHFLKQINSPATSLSTVLKLWFTLYNCILKVLGSKLDRAIAYSAFVVPLSLSRRIPAQYF